MHGLAVREAGSAYRWYFDRSRAAAERFSEQLYAAIQRVAADTVRARAASLASAFDKALTTVALLGVGVMPRR